MAGVDDIVKDPIDSIFIENAEIAVGMDIHFERFQLKTFFIGHVVQRDNPEVRQVCFWTNRRILGDLDGNFVAFILIWEGFDVR